ncbi:hypothetical protein [Zeimonas arvi]|uniref:hypothetical protein n=1 Tax=Zeimonas arvi TaxID=2498847 RepID=UPI0011C8713A|nr:hypothetical protein [Zeimonas arvi]
MPLQAPAEAKPVEPPPAEAAASAPRADAAPAWQPFERTRPAPANLADLLARAPAGADPLTGLAPPPGTEPRLPDWDAVPSGRATEARTESSARTEPSEHTERELPEPSLPEPRLAEGRLPEPKLAEPKLPEPEVPEPKLGTIDSKPGPAQPGPRFVEPKLGPAGVPPEAAEPQLRANGADPAPANRGTGPTEPHLGDIRASARPIGNEPRLGDPEAPVVRRARPAPAIELPARRSPAWLAPLLVLLVLAAGVGAFLAVWMSAPEGGGGGIDFGELAARARDRLVEWGLIAR